MSSTRYIISSIIATTAVSPFSKSPEELNEEQEQKKSEDKRLIERMRNALCGIFQFLQCKETDEKLHRITQTLPPNVTGNRPLKEQIENAYFLCLDKYR